jgi:hypothetical protein
MSENIINTAENAIGRIHRKSRVRSAPWIGAEPSEPKLPKARAMPVRALHTDEDHGEIINNTGLPDIPNFIGIPSK